MAGSEGSGEPALATKSQFASDSALNKQTSTEIWGETQIGNMSMSYKLYKTFNWPESRVNNPAMLHQSRQGFEQNAY